VVAGARRLLARLPTQGRAVRAALGAHAAALVAGAQDAILGLRLDGTVHSWNRSAARLIGYPPRQLRGHPFADLLAEPARAEWAARLADLAAGLEVPAWETWLTQADGARTPVAVTLSPLRAARGQVIGASVILRDITAQQQAATALLHLARHDPLTGLANRTLLAERLQSALSSLRPSNATMALLLLDLDHFKDVNDTLGHPAGDALLVQVAARLQAAVRATDTVARLGGDEFAVIAPAAEARAAGRLARRLLRVLDEPVEIAGQDIVVGASVGIALYPAHGPDGSGLLRRADVAMYQAKRSGSGYAIYDPEADPYSPQRLQLISDLRQALASGGLQLHYQPLVSPRTGQAAAVEALVRWPHPTRGFIPPSTFLPLAEHTGLIRPLTAWVLDAALAQARSWRAQGWPVPIAVNLSLADLRDPHLPGTLQGLLERWEIDPSGFCVEITETAMMSDPAHTLGVLTWLRRLGVALAIDDFGTGYSSLSLLKRLPVTQLKIDQSLIADLVDQPHDAAIVRAAVDIGHSLGLQVVAEGIENAATWAQVGALGCDEGQGYYLSRPAPAEVLHQRWSAPDHETVA
jgi:diguanylate cyclase (GGDEF)-like protein/PAS domain S-box-containing protein